MLAGREFGRSGVRLTELGLGTAALGNLYQPLTDSEAQSTVDECWSQGVRYFDTAPLYGFGLSEQRLGAALAGRPREQFNISCKVGRTLHRLDEDNLPRVRHGFVSTPPYAAHFDYSYDGIMRSFESSLRRLRVSSVDILLIHDIGRLTHQDRHEEQLGILKRSGMRAVTELRESGLVRALGLGCNEWEICDEALDWGPIDGFLLAGRYTLLEQSPLARFFPRCAERGASVVLGGVFNSGILATGTQSGAPLYYDYAPAPPQIVAKVSAIEQVCRRFHVPLGAAAVQFPLACPQVTAIIPGARSPAEVLRFIEYWRFTIPAEFWEALRQQDLIDADAAIPKGVPG
ncbi:MAG: aldo/keto reductase, partial [Proteobacteria bacterium]|nr:aldo/keto reductase [Pseudomonadota bacterium]